MKLKVTKLLVSQFKFLVDTDKNTFVYKFFLSLKISDFSLFFSAKTVPPTERGWKHTMLGHPIYLLIGSRREDHNKVRIFHVLFVSFLISGDISTAGFKGSRFEFNQQARLEFKPTKFESHCANLPTRKIRKVIYEK